MMDWEANQMSLNHNLRGPVVTSYGTSGLACFPLVLACPPVGLLAALTRHEHAFGGSGRLPLLLACPSAGA